MLLKGRHITVMWHIARVHQWQLGYLLIFMVQMLQNP